MTLFELCALVITPVALFGYVNCRLLHLPDTIGILAIALLCSLAAAGIGLLHSQVARWTQTAVAHIDFTSLVFVVMGLMIGNHDRQYAMSDQTQRQLFVFWELVDDLLNLLLFGLVCLELVAVAKAELKFFAVALIAVPIVLVARVGSVALPIGLLRVWRPFEPGIVRIMTWGGLRGAISIALALSLPHGAIRDIIVSATYFVAVFSILIQALTLPLLTRRWFRHSDSPRAAINAINGERSIIPKSGADNG